MTPFRNHMTALCLSLFCLHTAAGQDTAVKNYPTLKQSIIAINLLKRHKNITVSKLATTGLGHPVQLITVSTGQANLKPAILILGNVTGKDHAATQITIGMVEQLAEKSKLLKNTTFYLIPIPSPDAVLGFETQPFHAGDTNHRPFDDDKDFQLDEDGPEDLNGDGWITQMRIKDVHGKYLKHKDDGRIMVLADAKNGQVGTHRVLIEGIDNDKDGLFNEDGVGGTAFNKNHTFNYGFFEPGAGPHQVSEPETRAIVEFAYKHTHIYAVYSFSEQDNLNSRWISGGNGRIPTQVEILDARYFSRFSKAYKSIFKGRGASTYHSQKGSFSRWAYFHYGRWSLTAPSFSVNLKANLHKSKTNKTKTLSTKVKKNIKPTPKISGNADVNRLRYLERQGLAGFVPWQKIKHPDFPGQVVEVGGFKPFVLSLPNFSKIPRLTQQNIKFIEKVAGSRAKLIFLKPKIEPLGQHVYRITVTVRNVGNLPTVSTMGKRTKRLQVLQLKVIPPVGTQFIRGKKITRLGQINPLGQEKRVYTLSLDAKASPVISFKVWSPCVGQKTLILHLIDSQ